MAFRTKKISQMDPKGSNLASTDLLEISQLVSGSYVTKSITGAQIAASAPAAAWGTITGTLSSQTDLNTALSGKVPTTRTLTINGTTQDLSADRTFTISTGITIGTTAITSGTVGRVLFEGTGNVVQESANLFWDNTNGRLGIGGTPSTFNLDVVGTARVRTTASSYASALLVENTGSAGNDNINVATFQGNRGNASTITDNTNVSIWQKSNIVNNYSTLSFLNSAGNSSAYIGTQFLNHGGGHSGNLFFGTASGGAISPKMTLFSTGNVGINTTTDAGFKLDVNGTARVTSLFVNLSTGSIPFMGASGLLTQNNSSLFWDNTNVRLGIGTATPLDRLHISTNSNNGVRLSCNASNGNSISLRDIDGTSQGVLLGTGTSFVYGTYRALQATLNGGSGGVGLRTGNGANAHISFYSGNADADLSTERLRLVASTGNVLINTTTDAGFKLDVNGTARVSGQATIAGTTNASAGIGRNTLINGTITATANSNVLVGLDIEPTFNTGAFTGVETLALRVTGFISNFTSSGATQIRIIGPSGSNKSLFFFNSSTTFASTRIYNQGTTNHLIFATGDSLSNPTDRFTIFASTGNVGINTTTDVASSKLTIESTTQGFLPPRMTTTQKNAIASPATGLMVYDTTLNVITYYNGTTWI